ncbi:MAG: porin family protein [Spirochaetaceae bacterium]|jgi:hypothetical protein|nr:porin family protein [Spirochaetaceae bacterium]
MKKVLALFLCMMTCGAALFAQEQTNEAQANREQANANTGLRMSAGGGLILQPVFGSEKYKGSSSTVESSGFGAGLNVFFDAKYVEVNLGLIFANEKSSKDDKKGFDTSNLFFGILGKYPISLNEKISLFPFLGFDYRVTLGASYDGTKSDDASFIAEHFNALSLVFGAGADYDISEKLYLRGELGFGITFNTKNEDDNKDSYDSRFKGKLPIKLTVGYRL